MLIDNRDQCEIVILWDYTMWILLLFSMPTAFSSPSDYNYPPYVSSSVGYNVPTNEGRNPFIYGNEYSVNSNNRHLIGSAITTGSIGDSNRPDYSGNVNPGHYFAGNEGNDYESLLSRETLKYPESGNHGNVIGDNIGQILRGAGNLWGGGYPGFFNGYDLDSSSGKGGNSPAERPAGSVKPLKSVSGSFENPKGTSKPSDSNTVYSSTSHPVFSSSGNGDEASKAGRFSLGNGIIDLFVTSPRPPTSGTGKHLEANVINIFHTTPGKIAGVSGYGKTAGIGSTEYYLESTTPGSESSTRGSKKPNVPIIVPTKPSGSTPRNPEKNDKTKPRGYRSGNVYANYNGQSVSSETLKKYFGEGISSLNSFGVSGNGGGNGFNPNDESFLGGSIPTGASPSGGDFPPPVIRKHIYVHIPPADTEYKPAPVTAPQAPERHYRIIFIKAPSAPPPTVSPTDLNLNSEKTLIYILFNKPDGYQIAQANLPVPTEPTKPEVFFIGYKGPNGGGEAVEQSGQNEEQQVENQQYQSSTPDSRNLGPTEASVHPGVDRIVQGGDYPVRAACNAGYTSFCHNPY